MSRKFFICLFLFFAHQSFSYISYLDDTDNYQKRLSVFEGLPVPKDKNILFYIQKNVNPNTIVYALKTSTNGRIDSKDPMEVFWRRYQEDGRKKKLGWLERTFAFDFDVKPVKEKPNTYVFHLVALKKRKFYFTQDKKDKPRVVTMMNGKSALIEKVYLMVDDSKRIHRVLSAELFGKYTKTGKPAYEKINND